MSSILEIAGTSIRRHVAEEDNSIRLSWGALQREGSHGLHAELPQFVYQQVCCSCSDLKLYRIHISYCSLMHHCRFCHTSHSDGCHRTTDITRDIVLKGWQCPGCSADDDHAVHEVRSDPADRHQLEPHSGQHRARDQQSRFPYLLPRHCPRRQFPGCMAGEVALPDQSL